MKDFRCSPGVYKQYVLYACVRLLLAITEEPTSEELHFQICILVMGQKVKAAFSGVALASRQVCAVSGILDEAGAAHPIKLPNWLHRC